MHVAVETGNTLLSNCKCQEEKFTVTCTHDTKFTAGLSYDRIFKENTHNASAPCTSNTFSGRRRPDANLFQSLIQRLSDTDV